jgi:site-specific DNA-methyltransferase (adenine-specific)
MTLPEPYYETPDGKVTLYAGDCRDLMAEIAENSVDAIVTDPPYGLEFMGKEWDKLLDDLPNAAALAKRRGYQNTKRQDRSQPSSRHGSRFQGKPRQFRRCRICGKRERSGSPCRCPRPDWEIEYPQGPISGMVAQQRWHYTWAVAALRVLKPGSHALVFGGTRTFHRLTCALEDAGFEIRDCLMWLYGSGFPKSLDVSKAIDKAAGAEREVVGRRTDRAATPVSDFRGGRMHAGGAIPGVLDNSAITAPATDAARQWEGWGSALKPAWEPIILARKPLSGTVAANVQEYGTGGLNIDGCRIGTADTRCNHSSEVTGNIQNWRTGKTDQPTGSPAGRWPANLLLECTCEETREGRVGTSADGGFKDTPARSWKNTSKAGIRRTGYADPDGKETVRIHTDPNCPCAMLDAQSGKCRSSGIYDPQGTNEWRPSITYGGRGVPASMFGDSGGASRFFYCAKADSAERNGSKHPTVKPLDLMRYLCRLVMPPNGLILDPFAGSGTMLEAAHLEGFRCVGIEMSEEYCADAERRLARYLL